MRPENENIMILKMIEDGSISPDEGVKLLNSIGGEDPIEETVLKPKKPNLKWFRVKVTDITTGKTKATVSLPMSLMDWGLRVGAQFAPEVQNVKLDELSEIFSQGLKGKIIDVLDEEDGEHVEIFVD